MISCIFVAPANGGYSHMQDNFSCDLAFRFLFALTGRASVALNQIAELFRGELVSFEVSGHDLSAGGR